MKTIYNNNIANDILQCIFSSNDSEYISFHCLLTNLSNKYHLNIVEKYKPGTIAVQGDNGIQIIATLFFLLKEMESKRIILMIKMIEMTDAHKEYNIQDSQADTAQTGFLIGDLKVFLEDNINTNIWYSPDIEWFKNNGYKAKELVEAECQTYYAHKTLVYAIFTFIATFLASVLQIVSLCICLKICCMIGIIVILYFLFKQEIIQCKKKKL